MFTKYGRGMVYWANLPRIEKEPNLQQGRRPCIIVSNNVGNIFSKNVIVVPCTTNVDKNDQPTHTIINLNRNEDSLVLAENVTAVCKDLLEDFMGMIDETDMKKVDNCLTMAIGLTEVPKPEPKKKEPPTLTEKTIQNRGRKVSGPSEMRQFLNFYEQHGKEETAAEYGIPNTNAVAQRVNYYKRQLGGK